MGLIPVCRAAGAGDGSERYGDPEPLPLCLRTTTGRVGTSIPWKAPQDKETQPKNATEAGPSGPWPRRP